MNDFVTQPAEGPPGRSTREAGGQSVLTANRIHREGLGTALQAGQGQSSLEGAMPALSKEGGRSGKLQVQGQPASLAALKDVWLGRPPVPLHTPT